MILMPRFVMPAGGGIEEKFVADVRTLADSSDSHL
jgi:hypothetical protein